MMGSSGSGKHSKSPSSSSSLLKSSSSSSLSSSSRPDSKADRIQRDKDRIEEVKRLLGGNKLDTTTFQIPKRTKQDQTGSSGSGSGSVNAGSGSSIDGGNKQPSSK